MPNDTQVPAQQKPVVDNAVLIGSAVVAAASYHPTVGAVIAKNPEAVSTVMTIILTLLKLFIKR